MKKLLLISLATLSLLVFVVGCSSKEVVSKDTSSGKNTVASSTSSNGTSVELGEFKSNKLGFSLSFPESWKDKYRIEENDTSVTVYFKPKEKVEDGLGMFFTIIKKTDDLDEGMYDSIYGVNKHFKINDVTYFIGGPTDLNFPEDNSEFKDFLKMKKEIPEVLKTLK